MSNISDYCHVTDECERWEHRADSTDPFILWCSGCGACLGLPGGPRPQPSAPSPLD